MVFLLSMMIVTYILAVVPIKAKLLIGNNVARVEEGKYSYVVSIAHRNEFFHEEVLHFCTGVLITENMVLTAAHCLDGELLSGIQFIVGSVDLRKGRKYGSIGWITYNQWAESKNMTKTDDSNDIAIVKLSYGVSSDVAKPASLSFSGNKLDHNNEYVVLVGWGSKNERSSLSSRYLQKVKVRVLSNAICEKTSYNIFKVKVSIPNKLLCTKGVPQAALLGDGDSGGPVLWKNSVVAISRSTCSKLGPCDLPEQVINNHKFNLHTDINFYTKFIHDVLKNNLQ